MTQNARLPALTTTVFEPLRTLVRLGSTEPGFRLALAMAVAGSAIEAAGVLSLGSLFVALGGRHPAQPGSGSLTATVGSMPLLASVLALILLVALRWRLRQLTELRFRDIEHGLVDRLRGELFAGLQRAEWRWFSRQRRSELVDRLIQCGKLGEGVFAGLQAITTAMTILVLVVLSWILSWQLAAASLVGALVYYAVSRRQLLQAVIAGRELELRQRAVHRAIQEGISHVRLNRLLHREELARTGLEASMGAQRDLQRRFNVASHTSAGLSQLAAAVLLAALLWVGHTRLGMPLTRLAPFVIAMVRLAPLLTQAASRWQAWLLAKSLVESHAAFSAEVLGAAEEDGSTGDALPALDREIRADRLHFRYAPDSPPVFEDLTFVIAARTTTAIVGPSGAGKSSLADILTGLHEPDQGEVSVDGVALKGATRLRWRRSVAYLDQHHALVHGSVRENLLAAAPDATEPELRRALAQASAGFVGDLPGGLDAEIGDDGVRLSGGQRQRIALARALLGRPQLLVLDEATSALDPASEREVADAIAALRGQTTIVLISHAPWATGLADHVVRLGASQ